MYMTYLGVNRQHGLGTRSNEWLTFLSHHTMWEWVYCIEAERRQYPNYPFKPSNAMTDLIDPLLDNRISQPTVTSSFQMT